MILTAEDVIAALRSGEAEVRTEGAPITDAMDLVSLDSIRNNYLAAQAILGAKGEPGLQAKDVKDAFRMFTKLNPDGTLRPALIGRDGGVANLAEMYETLDLRGAVGQYLINPLADTAEGYTSHAKGGKAERIIENVERKVPLLELGESEDEKKEEKDKVLGQYVIGDMVFPVYPEIDLDKYERFVGKFGEIYERDPKLAKMVYNLIFKENFSGNLKRALDLTEKTMEKEYKIWEGSDT